MMFSGDFNQKLLITSVVVFLLLGLHVPKDGQVDGIPADVGGHARRPVLNNAGRLEDVGPLCQSRPRFVKESVVRCRLVPFESGKNISMGLP